MPFAYYNKLSRARQRVYDESDRIDRIELRDALALQPLALELRAMLAAERVAKVKVLCQQLAYAICDELRAPRVHVQVLAVRPSADWGELHGMYWPDYRGKGATIQLWMRTAKNKRVVAFKSFLRTLLHELCHHLDYEHFKLAETFHTEGFYKRESSLFHQLVPDAAPGNRPESQ